MKKKGNAEQDVFVYVYFCVIMLLFFVVVVLWVFCLFVCLFVCLFFCVFLRQIKSVGAMHINKVYFLSVKFSEASRRKNETRRKKCDDGRI